MLTQSLITRNFTSSYLELLDKVANEGDVVKPRGKETREISPFLLTIQNPLERVTALPGRDINTFFLIVEALWILGGRDDVKTLAKFNSNIPNFSDDGLTFHAPYGQRLRHYGSSIEHKTMAKMSVYEKSGDIQAMKSMHAKEIEFDIDQLKIISKGFAGERDSRQLVASIWSVFYDLSAQNFTKDVPCNDLLMFKIRKGALNLTVDNRSNDIHWGLPTNIFQFSFVLEAMAFTLGIPVGRQSHAIDSLHFYTEDPTKPGTPQIINTKLDYGRKNFSLKNLYETVKPTSMFLNKHFADEGIKHGYTLYELLFENVIESSLYAIDCFDDFESQLLSALGGIIDLNEGKLNLEVYKITFAAFEKSYNTYLPFKTLKAKSDYFDSLIQISLAYALFKRMRTAKNTLTNKQFMVNQCLAHICFMILFSRNSGGTYYNKDMRISGLNFVYTRYYQRAMRAIDDFEMYSYKEMLDLIQDSLNNFEVSEQISEFIKEVRKS